MEKLEKIISAVDGIEGRLIEFRRQLHRNPELSGNEEKTASFVAGVLEDNHIEVRRNVGGHGLVGLLKGGAGDGPVIALRADMDALPIHDGKDEEYASSVDGVMHACGHDVHTAILIGTAIVLGGLREELKGSVKFIFQPEEESIAGADRMIKSGALESPLPDAIVALHCLPEMEMGKVGLKAGIMAAAADGIRITIKGKSGHASRPHQTVDAVLVSSMVINAIHHIVSRRTDPLHPAVISIGKIKGGTAENVIADHVEMAGTVRTLDPELRKKMPSIIEGVVKGISGSMGAEYEMDYVFECPPVFNDAHLNNLVSSCAADVLGDSGCVNLEDPMMGSEDFALFAEKVPGVLFRLGTANQSRGIGASLHNSLFDVDENSIAIGTKILSWTAARFVGFRE